MEKKLTPYEIGQRAKQIVAKNKEQDRAMDRILDRTIPMDRSDESWHLEHSEFSCMECRTSWGDEHPLNFYLGQIDGEDAHKYECTNPECGHKEIILMKDMKGE